jgi:LysM repeat protein
LNVTHATNAFLDVAVQYSNSNPGAGPGTIAQGTQRSEVPDAYDKAEGRARDLLSKTAARAGSGSSSSGGTTNVGSNPSSGSSSSSGCTMATTKAGDTGNVFASRNGVSWAQIVSLNPGLNSSGNNLVAGKAYCVKKSTSTSGGTTNVGSNPSSGSTSSSACTMATVKPGDTGNAFASRNGVSWAQIVSLNSGLNSSGNNLVANKAYCVKKGSTSSSTSSGTTNVGSNPSSAKCSKKATVKAGDSGSTFASRNGLTYAQLRTFNPTLNASGTNLTAGGSYCLN